MQPLVVFIIVRVLSKMSHLRLLCANLSRLAMWMITCWLVMLHTWLKWMVFFSPRKNMKYRQGKNCDIFFPCVKRYWQIYHIHHKQNPQLELLARFLWKVSVRLWFLLLCILASYWQMAMVWLFEFVGVWSSCTSTVDSMPGQLLDVITPDFPCHVHLCLCISLDGSIKIPHTNLRMHGGCRMPMLCG